MRNGSVRIQINEIIDSPKVITPGNGITWSIPAPEMLTIYVDGNVVAEGTLRADVTQTENLMLGKIVVPKQDSFRLTGAIDELEIWDDALEGAKSSVASRRSGNRSLPPLRRLRLNHRESPLSG